MHIKPAEAQEKQPSSSLIVLMPVRIFLRNVTNLTALESSNPVNHFSLHKASRLPAFSTR